MLSRSGLLFITWVLTWSAPGLGQPPPPLPSPSSAPSEVPLPERLGSLNDYAGQIGSARASLEAQIRAIQEQFGVEVVVLLTLLDPFSHPPTLAARLAQHWKLSQKAALLLFVRERGRWRHRLWLSPDLVAVLPLEGLRALERHLGRELERRRVRAAVELALDRLDGLLAQAFSPPLEERAAEQGPEALQGRGTQGPNAQTVRWLPALAARVPYVLGGLAGLLLARLLVRRLVRRLCPRCGARLRARRHRWGPYREVVSRRCPRCGYGRLDRV